MSLKFLNQNSSGQTLIETMVAVFILVMGVSAAVGLAVYAFSASTTIEEQIIATGLAREGLEAVINMRDTNWLQDTLQTNSCYDYISSESDAASCYLHWLNQTYCLDPSQTGGVCAAGSTVNNYILGFDYSNSNYWVLIPATGSSATDYGLNFNPGSGTTGFYSPGATGVPCTNTTTNAPGVSDYCRKIIITKDTSDAPYNQDANLPLLKVESIVWWGDKNCPPRPSDYTIGMRCSIELDTYLTNWKNY